MSNELLNVENRYQGFKYPKAFKKALELNLTDLEVWYIMAENQVQLRIDGLRKRYPRRKLIPFARRDDNDDVACFELGKGSKVFVIHDFADEGWESRKEFSDFWDWFESAIKEMVEFQREEEQHDS
jgi:hypothetical protein